MCMKLDVILAVMCGRVVLDGIMGGDDSERRSSRNGSSSSSKMVCDVSCPTPVCTVPYHYMQMMCISAL